MTPLLSFNHVCYAYPRGIEALRDITFSLQKGERVALLGLNGSGKSTLLLHTNGLLLPTQGTVNINGTTVDSKHLAMARQTVGMVFQNSDDQLFMSSVEEDVAFGPRNMKLCEEEIKDRVEKALQLTGTTLLRHRSSFQLSGGQQRMAALATVLSMTPDLLALDEPTSGLDFESTARFVGVIEKLEHSLLMSTHDIALAQRLCSRAIVMESGTIVYDGPIADMTYPSRL